MITMSARELILEIGRPWCAISVVMSFITIIIILTASPYDPAGASGLNSKQRDIQYHTGSMCSPYWLTLNLHIYNLFLSPMTAIAQHSHTSWSELTKRRFFSSEWSVISQVEFYWEIFLLWEAEHLRQYSVRTLRHGQSQPSSPPEAWKPLICMALLLRGSRGYFDTERQNSIASGPFCPSW